MHTISGKLRQTNARALKKFSLEKELSEELHPKQYEFTILKKIQIKSNVNSHDKGVDEKLFARLQKVYTKYNVGT